MHDWSVAKKHKFKESERFSTCYEVVGLPSIRTRWLDNHYFFLSFHIMYKILTMHFYWHWQFMTEKNKTFLCLSVVTLCSTSTPLSLHLQTHAYTISHSHSHSPSHFHTTHTHWFRSHLLSLIHSHSPSFLSVSSFSFTISILQCCGQTMKT